jgi:homoprotocatechuate degradation regulator HpaR
MLNDPAQTETARVAMQKESTSPRAKRSKPMREFSRSLPMALLRGREAVMRHFRPLLRAHGLSEQQWRILRALTAVETIEVTELAERAYLLGPSLSRMLRDLEARKLIARKLARDDQRRSMVSITPKGRALIETVAPFSEAVYAQIARHYGAAKLGELQDLLHALEASLSALPVRHAAEAVDSPKEFRSTRQRK